MLRQIGPFGEIGEQRPRLLLRKSLALRLLMTSDCRGSLVHQALSIIVRFIEHHYVPVFSGAHPDVSVSVSHTLIKGIAAWSIAGCRSSICSRRFVQVLVVRHVRAGFARFGPWLLMSLQGVAGGGCARLEAAR